MIDQNRGHCVQAEIFARFWGFALFIQTVSTWWWLTLLNKPGGASILALPEIAVGVLGLTLFFAPGNLLLRILPLAAAVQLFNLALQLPEIPNHRLLCGFINVAILIFLRPTAQFQANKGASSWPEFSATVRAMLVAMYAFAVFHKLNIDFLFGPLSCGKVYALETFEFFGLAQTPVLTGALPIVTLLIEFLIPALLLTRKFAWWGAALGFAFHALLIFHPTKHFIDFTCVIYGALITTLPVNKERDLFSGILGKLAFLLGVFLVINLAIAAARFPIASSAFYIATQFILWVLFIFVGLWVLSSVVWPARRLSTNLGITNHLIPCSVSGWLLVFLVLLNGATPYLGIKNKVSWDMYSNLRLEEGVSNHLLFAGNLNLAGEMGQSTGQLVKIIASNIPELEQLRINRLELARLELDRIVRRTTAPQVSYIWQQKSFEITESNLKPDGYEASYLKRKLLWFRPMVQAGEPVPCNR